jgi:paired amphipathic helix protein Sin3a
MSVRVGLPSYKLMYESGTEDVQWRGQSAELRGRAAGREEERRKSRWIAG